MPFWRPQYWQYRRKPDVGSFECGSIIRTVTSGTGSLAERAKGFGEDLLIFGGRPRRGLETGDVLDALLWVKSTRDRTFHGDASSGIDTAPGGGQASGGDVVSGTHLDSDACMVAGGDSLAGIGAEGVFGTGDSSWGHVARGVLIRNLIGGLEVGTSGGLALEISITECDSPQHLVCVEDDRPGNVVLGDLVKRFCLNLRVCVLTIVRVLGDDDLVGALLRKDLRCALEEQMVTTGLEKGGLSLSSYESELLGLWVDIFKCSRVERDGLIEQALQLRGKDGVDVVLLDREIVSVFAVGLGTIGGIGNVLFLGLGLVLIGCACPGLVLLEVANKFCVNTD
jgi:hypothetical protein